jgi:hypothetical protein
LFCGILVGTLVIVNCGFRVGKSVVSTLGATTGARVNVDDEGKLVEGENVVGSEVPVVGRLVGVAVGDCVGSLVTGSSIGFRIGLDFGSSVLFVVGSAVEGDLVKGVSDFGC